MNMSKTPKAINMNDSKVDVSKVGMKRELIKKIRPQKRKKTSRGK